MFLIEEELKKLPGKPGVYIMHGGEYTTPAKERTPR